MKVLVTGGAGMIGRRLALSLLEAGHDVIIIDLIGPKASRTSADLSRIAASAVWMEGDVRDCETVLKMLTTFQIDSIAHLAGGSSFASYLKNPVGETTNVTEGFLSLIEAARQAGVSRIVNASTSAVYEGNPFPYDEGMTLSPPDLKSLAKKMTEEIADIYSSRYGVDTISLRPFSVYGDEEMAKGPLANVVSLFSWAATAGRPLVLWGDGTQTRDFIYVDDVAEAFKLALEKDRLTTQSINVGTGLETSYIDLAEIIGEVLGRDQHCTFIDIPVSVYARRLKADTHRAMKVLGFEAAVPLCEGVVRVLEHAQIVGVENDSRLLHMAQEVEFFKKTLTRSGSTVP